MKSGFLLLPATIAVACCGAPQAKDYAAGVKPFVIATSNVGLSPGRADVPEVGGGLVYEVSDERFEGKTEPQIRACLGQPDATTRLDGEKYALIYAHAVATGQCAIKFYFGGMDGYTARWSLMSGTDALSCSRLIAGCSSGS